MNNVQTAAANQRHKRGIGICLSDLTLQRLVSGDQLANRPYPMLPSSVAYRRHCRRYHRVIFPQIYNDQRSSSTRNSLHLCRSNRVELASHCRHCQRCQISMSKQPHRFSRSCRRLWPSVELFGHRVFVVLLEVGTEPSRVVYVPSGT